MVNEHIFISICIPTYKRFDFLKRLLDSVSIQSYSNFEVIITDDSQGNDIYNLCQQYNDRFVLRYYKNPVALGTPENWNEAIRHAQGQWIKIMHDDDWFGSSESLLEFVNATKQNPASSFFYCAYVNVFENNAKKVPVYINSFRKKRLQKNPATLFSKNVIGPPSVTLVRNDKKIWYDNKTKWVVDIDFYIQYLKKNSSFYIARQLINVGINTEQVTRSAFRVSNIEIPENFYLLNKVGIRNLQEILIYDAWWRIIRNLKIGSLVNIRESGYHGEVPSVINAMISWQSEIPSQILQIGFFSKMIMFVHYLIYRRFLK